ncbi:MAG: ABC transporter permease, partial [Blastocatellia bacterium]
MKPHLRLIQFIGLIVPQRLRADWRQEWEAELRYREELLAEWDKLNWQTKLDLLWRSTSAFWDALWLQPRRWEDEMFQDLRFGIRMLLKQPGFTLIAVLTLAIGISANTVVFSIINAVLLRPRPVAAPERLVELYSSDARNNPYGGSSYQDYLSFREQGEVFSGLAAYRHGRYKLGGEDGVEPVIGEAVSGNYFDVLGVKAFMGRTFLPEEDRTPGSHPVVVIGH